MRQAILRPLRFFIENGISEEEILKLGGAVVPGNNVVFTQEAIGFKQIANMLDIPIKEEDKGLFSKTKLSMMNTVGPRLWKMIHTWALTANLSTAPSWINGFYKLVPCGECKQEFSTILRENPPRYSSNEDLFIWTVEVHNTINKKLGKVCLTLEQAKEMWYKELPTENTFDSTLK